MEKIKKVKTLFVINIVLAIVLLIVGMILCFIPTVSMKENSEGISSTSISAIDILFKNTEAEVLKDGIATGETVNLSYIFPTHKYLTTIGGIRGLMLICLGFAAFFEVLSILVFLINLLRFSVSTKKKVQDGSLVIRQHLLQKHFVFPIRLLDSSYVYFPLFSLLPMAVQFIFDGHDMNFAGYGIAVAIIYFVISLLVSGIISQMAKKELDAMSDEEVMEIFPNQTVYSDAIAAKKAIEARKEENKKEEQKQEHEQEQDIS